MSTVDKYISMKKSVDGFSFANLGFFYGFGNGIITAIYSLVLLEIFKNSATVGIYVAIYSGFCMLISLFVNEFLKRFSKSQLLYISFLLSAIVYFMMSFTIKPLTFIALDFTVAFPVVMIAVLIPLFMADFSKDVGMARLSGRYHLWLNAGALFAPVVAMTIAGMLGMRAPFFVAAAIFAIGLFFFKRFGIVQKEKEVKKVHPKKTLLALATDADLFFRNQELSKAYFVNFGYYALHAMRVLYVPIMVIEHGFSKDVLGLMLTLGIVPYVILAEPMGRLAKKHGSKIWMGIGLVSFSLLAFWASFATGWTLIAIFVVWQLSGAIMEPVHDLLFFDIVNKKDEARFYGMFKTSRNITKFIMPLIGAGFILFFGGTFAVWIATGIIGLLSAWVLVIKTNKKV